MTDPRKAVPGGWDPQAPGAPLFDALERGDLAAVERLLAEGADVDMRDPRLPEPFAAPPLVVAACRGDTAMVRSLLAHGADVDARDGAGGTALIWACDGGDLECARLLLDAGADPRLRNRDGYTARDRTPRRSEALLRLLPEHGAG